MFDKAKTAVSMSVFASIVLFTLILTSCGKDRAIMDTSTQYETEQIVETAQKDSAQHRASKPPAPKEPTILYSCADADFDGDGKIGQSDLNMLVGHMDSNNGGEPKHAGTIYDMNKDGTVNYSDVSFFAK